MKNIIRNLSVLSLLGSAAYGGSTGDDVEKGVPVVHGYEINLPLFRTDMLAPGWCVYDFGGWGKFHPCDYSYRATMDWGGGNALFYVTEDSWYDPDDIYGSSIQTRLDQIDAFVPIAHVLGYYAHVEPGLVRGSIEMLVPNQWGFPTPAQSEIILALQVEEPTGWRDVTTLGPVSITNIRQMHEIEALVVPNQRVRFEVRARARSDHEMYYSLYKVRMFGAQCYVDFSNSSACL